MKISIFTFVFWLTLEGACYAATVVPPAADIQRMERLFRESVSTAYRLELMTIASEAFIDPPPDAGRFAQAANVTISIDALSGYEFLDDLLEALRSSKWEEGEMPGYPRWCWRVLGPSDRVEMEFLVDSDSSAIGYKGRWYRVSRGLVDRLTSEFVAVCLNRLPRKGGAVSERITGKN